MIPSTNIFIFTHPNLSAQDNRYWRFTLQNNQVILEKYSPETNKFDPHIPKDAANNELNITQGIFLSAIEFQYHYLDWSKDGQLFAVDESNVCKIFNFEKGGWIITDKYTPATAWQKDIVKIDVQTDDDLMQKNKDYILQMDDQQEEADQSIVKATAEIAYNNKKAAEAALYPEKIEEYLNEAFEKLTIGYRKFENIYQILCTPENQNLDDFRNKLDSNDYFRENLYEIHSGLPLLKISQLPDSPGFDKKLEKQKAFQRLVNKENELKIQGKNNLRQALEQAEQQQIALREAKKQELLPDAESQKTVQVAESPKPLEVLEPQKPLQVAVLQNPLQMTEPPLISEIIEQQTQTPAPAPAPAQHIPSQDESDFHKQDKSVSNSNQNTSKPLQSSIKIRILGGFIAALGIAAVFSAFVFLNAATLGTGGLIVASLGVASILSGMGLFAKSFIKNKQPNNSDLSLNGSESLSVVLVPI